MKILILCGVAEKEAQQEVIAHSRGGADLAANLFQQKLIAGFRSLGTDCEVLSAPFLGAYPMRCDPCGLQAGLLFCCKLQTFSNPPCFLI